MSWVEAARQVVTTGSFKMVSQDGEMQPTVWDGDEVSPASEGVLLDLFSASVMVQVHDVLSEANQAKFAAMPLTTAHNVAFKLANRTEG